MTDPLLTPAEVRRLVATSATDEDIAKLIAAATSAVARLAGDLGPITEVRAGASSVIILARRVAATPGFEIREAGHDDPLEADDYFLRSDHRSIDRLSTGTNPGRLWRGPVVVAYTPEDDALERRAIVLKLVQLDLAGMPGVLGFTEGNWSIQFPNGESWGATRGDLLGQASALWHFG